MAKERDESKFGETTASLDDAREAIAHDGGILGDPNGFRFATGKRNVDVTMVGEEMLRGRHKKGGDPG